MTLHHLGWMALAGAVVMAQPASATSNPALQPLQPLIQKVSVPAPAVPVSATPAPSTDPAAVPQAQPPVEAVPPAAVPQGTQDPAALQVPTEPATPPEPPKPVLTLFVDIDLTKQQLTVKSGGEVIHSWKISSGRWGYLTPTGTFKPQWRSRMWYSRQYDGAPMPYAVFFNGGIATHGTYATGMLGRPASHGCIRLATPNAKALYNLISKHGMESTQIAVRGSAYSPAVAKRMQKERQAEQRPRRQQGGYAYRAPQPWWAW